MEGAEETVHRLILGDCVEAMRGLDADSVDAVICDPPYLIGFMGKEFDEQGGAHLSPSGAQRWHGAWAREALRVLKPGGHLLAFGGTRTYHRLAAGIEDAGFEIRDCLAWMYGSGFPKSLDVAKSIDKVLGVEGGRGEMKRGGERLMAQAPGGVRDGDGRWGDEVGRDPYTYVSASPEAKAWDGWGTALKPAFEPVVVARKPLAGTVAANVLEHGVGGLNVDACRITFASPADEAESKDKNRHADFDSGPRENAIFGADERTRAEQGNYDAPGRWPANVLLGHSPECVPFGTARVRTNMATRGESRPDHVFAFGNERGDEPRGYADADGREAVEVWDCVAECPVRLLDEQTGELAAGNHPALRTGRGDEKVYGSGSSSGTQGERRPTETGGASRFFYCAKVSRAERNAGLDGFEEHKIGVGDERPSGQFGERLGHGSGHAEHLVRQPTTRRNLHPTVKPIDLMRWLIRLVVPPGGTLLDPFAGSGSTGCAAELERVGYVLIERDPDYMRIVEARTAFWRAHGEDGLRVVRERDAAEGRRQAVEDAGQLDLFSGG